MLTYALGRGVEWYDKCAVDEIVAQLKEDDRFSTLILGIVNTAAFQMRSAQKAASVTWMLSRSRVDVFPVSFPRTERTMKPLSRRTLLKGLGASLGLPVLDAMLPCAAWAVPETLVKTRMAFVYVPIGAIMQDWTPQREGADYELSKTLMPLNDGETGYSRTVQLRSRQGAAPRRWRRRPRPGPGHVLDRMRRPASPNPISSSVSRSTSMPPSGSVPRRGCRRWSSPPSRAGRRKM